MTILLRNSFTFGFELEAFGKTSNYLDTDEYDSDYFGDEYSCIDNMPCNYINDYDSALGSFYDGINSYINYNYNMKGRTHYDGSVGNYNKGYTAFEWSSPILGFTTSNLLRVKRFLSNLEKENIHINKSCGFHTHFSYKGICEKDVIWILTYIAMNEDALKTFTEFHYEIRKDGELFPEDVKVDFFNDRYADKHYLEHIKECFGNIDYIGLASIFDDSKYRVLRIHPQGTIEWRGPREFLYSKKGVNMYINTLYKVVDIFIKALNTNSINGITREEYFDNLKISYSKRNSDILPETTLRQQRTGSYGMLPWFRYTSIFQQEGGYRHYVNDTILKHFVEKIKEVPSEINDIKYSDYMKPIIGNLSNTNCLRKVIEYNVNNGIKLAKNVQYLMLFENITLLPYVEKDTWKYITYNNMYNIIRSVRFREESEYKHNTLDYMLNVLPNIYKPHDVLELLKVLVGNNNVDWICKYIMTNLKDSLYHIIDNIFPSDNGNKESLDIVKVKLEQDQTANRLDKAINYVLYGEKYDFFQTEYYVTLNNESLYTTRFDINTAINSNISDVNGIGDITSVTYNPNNRIVGNIYVSGDDYNHNDIGVTNTI